MRPRDSPRARSGDLYSGALPSQREPGNNAAPLDRYIITSYTAIMTPCKPTLLQMSAVARLAMALAACAVVWAVIGWALA